MPLLHSDKWYNLRDTESKAYVIDMYLAGQDTDCVYVTGSMGNEQFHSTNHAKQMKRNGSKSVSSTFENDACCYCNYNLNRFQYYINNYDKYRNLFTVDEIDAMIVLIKKSKTFQFLNEIKREKGYIVIDNKYKHVVKQLAKNWALQFKMVPSTLYWQEWMYDILHLFFWVIQCW